MAATASSRQRHQVNFWPGFVDVLSTLLMVVIFLLMVFVIAQFFLSEALTGRDAALERLNRQIAELSELLSLERSASAELRVNVAELSAELQTSIAARDELSRRLTVIIGERDALAADLAEASARLAVIDETGAAVQAKLDEAYAVIEAERAKLTEAYQTIEADREKIQALLTDIAALESLRDELSAKLLTGDQQVAAERQISEEAQRRVEILNAQLIALRQQLARLAAALDASEEQSREQEIQVADLGRRLNAALASRVEELARYRSEFFGRLRQVLGNREDIQIVGDRFVFQSEVLFETGSAELGEPGRQQLARLAETLLQIAATIPDDIDWVLRVDGHTDKRPIATPEFRSNWELSTARAISVVRFLESQGVQPKRLAAAGFAEFRPLDPADDDEAYRRNRRIELKLDQR